MLVGARNSMKSFITLACLTAALRAMASFGAWLGGEARGNDTHDIWMAEIVPTKSSTATEYPRPFSARLPQRIVAHRGQSGSQEEICIEYLC